MAVTGRLEDTGVPGILQVFSQGRRTGRLVFSTPLDQAVLILREGQLVYAASNAVRETLGNILVSQGSIDTGTLAAALQRQHEDKQSRRLGSVLVEMGAVTSEDVLEVVRNQALGVLKYIVGWDTGFFKFEKLELEDEGEVPVDLNDFLIEEGLRVDQALFDIAIDEEDEIEAAKADKRPARVSLREIVSSLSHPALNAEITQALIQFSQAFLDRTVLLLHKSGTLKGISQRGVTEGGDAEIRKLSFETAETPFFEQIIGTQQTFCGPIDGRSAIGQLAEFLGDPEPREVVVCPLVLRGETTLLLYGDAGGRPVEHADLLEAVMLQTSLAMENAVLQARVSELEKELEEARQPPEESTLFTQGATSAPTPGGTSAESSQRIADLLAGRTNV